MPTGKPVEIQKAKGRPMLTWVGKQPLKRVIAYPAQLVETFGDPALPSPLVRGQVVGVQGGLPSPAGRGQGEVDSWSDWPSTFPHSGLLFHGDNKDVLAYLLANGFRGKINLVYIDPPFDSGADYVRKVELRGGKTTGKIEGETYSLGEQIQYTDIWTNDSYLQFMYERIQLIKELLSENGSFFLHCDRRRSSYLRLICDEIFSEKNFRNEIIWAYTGPSRVTSDFPDKHENILRYSKNDSPIFNLDDVRIPYSKSFVNRRAYGEGKGGIYGDEDDPNRLLSEEDILKGKIPEDWWSDISSGGQISSTELVGFPTQKPRKLLERIIKVASNPGDLILDCFVGSGTTAIVAQMLGRRWIACDINKGAIQTSVKQLQSVILGQRSRPSNLPASLDSGDVASPSACQLSFSVYRVNDYDLQIQHNEALNLACEHLGVTRSKTDRYFDGTLGKNLVKIIPFNHPLTPLDLEEIKRELQNRPDETRSITVVSLGKELAVDAWLEEWNRFRKQRDIPNKIDLIELRTDPKAGGFFAHQPDQTEVEIKRVKDTLHIEIKSFISPTIIQRLNQQSGVLTPQIDDWRAMVDSVMIDTAYDGEVFNIVHADIPEKKTDLVAGVYDLPCIIGNKDAIVAVKITDMLGEEVLSINKVIETEENLHLT